MSNVLPIVPTVICAVVFAMSGCERKNEQVPRPDGRPPVAPVVRPDADNTERNAANRESTTKSPMDQSNSNDAIKITAAIRRAILDDNSMSVNAQNCKIITDATGNVTLRGPR
ncbi:MAG: hypothetical protein K2X32_05070 [Phycisphaerales bacterium]|nr:hypothetical protein [Phycisphaerales bacterium]